MNFVETFSAVFIATFMGQISVWIIERYIKHKLNKAADYIEIKLGKK